MSFALLEESIDAMLPTWLSFPVKEANDMSSGCKPVHKPAGKASVKERGRGTPEPEPEPEPETKEGMVRQLSQRDTAKAFKNRPTNKHASHGDH
ncbi:hypothetical protein WN943_004321 [Citrus x changshan-huyou]